MAGLVLLVILLTVTLIASFMAFLFKNWLSWQEEAPSRSNREDFVPEEVERRRLMLLAKERQAAAEMRRRNAKDKAKAESYKTGRLTVIQERKEEGRVAIVDKI